MTTGGGSFRSMRTLGAVVCLWGAAAAGAAGSQAGAPPDPGDGLGTGDVVRIAVYDQEQLSGLYTVEADGSFAFPPLGRIVVGGMTLRSLEELLTTRLADGHLRDPRVRAAMETLRSRRVSIIGEVANPGVFPLFGEMTLVEALATAGSTTERASHEVILMRPASGAAADGPGLRTEPEAADTIRMDLRDLQRGIARHGGVPLRNGDTVIVPRAPTIFVRGEVRNPGEYPLRRNDLTVSQLLARAGGGTPLGALNRIRALRIVDGEPREVRLELSDVVRPEDTIVVPRRFF